MSKTKRGFATFLGIVLAIGSAEGAGVNGHFVDVAVFFEPGTTGSGLAGIIGPPDKLRQELEDGGVTVRFSNVPNIFDYTVSIPSATDLILVDVGAEDVNPNITFGYDNAPVDSDADGIADGLLGIGTEIGFANLKSAPWDPGNGSQIVFYDLDETFLGLSKEFVISIDDVTGFPDFDLNSAQLVVPEPSSLIMIAFGLTLFCFQSRRRLTSG